MWHLTLLTLIQTVILISCQENTEPREIHIVVAKRFEDGNILLRLSKGVVNRGIRWQQIHAGNARNGDLSYFTAYDRSAGASRISNFETTHYGYEDNSAKPINVCSKDNEVSVITVSDCSGIDQDLSKKFSFYSANKQNQGTQQIYTTVCRDKRTLVAYSTLSTKNNFCWTGSRVVGGHNFFAHVGNIFCKPPGLPLRASFTVSIDHGVRVSSVTYRCANGYKLRGHGTLTCGNDGRWNHKMPNCEVVQCDQPPAIEHGTVPGRSTFAYTENVTYECDEGYTLYPPDAVLKCLATGMWSNDSIECRTVSCDPPIPPTNGYVDPVNYTYGESVEFKCNLGYSLIGSETATCQKNGTWSSYVTKCQRISCPTISIANSELGEYQLQVGNEITIECNVGYKIHEDNALSCQMKNDSSTEAVWNHPLPYCAIVNCTAPSPLQNGLIEGDEVFYGSELKYACNPGYSLLGNETLSCTMNGWSSKPPICQECSLGYYKEGTNTEQCIACPPNFNTTCPGSFSPLQCACKSNRQEINNDLWTGGQSGERHSCSISCSNGSSCSAAGLRVATCNCSPLPDVGHSKAVCEADGQVLYEHSNSTLNPIT